MKKKYTKKQIQEAISYWQKQLRTGNYKKVNESYDDDDDDDKYKRLLRNEQYTRRLRAKMSSIRGVGNVDLEIDDDTVGVAFTKPQLSDSELVEKTLAAIKDIGMYVEENPSNLSHDGFNDDSVPHTYVEFKRND